MTTTVDDNAVPPSGREPQEPQVRWPPLPAVRNALARRATWVLAVCSLVMLLLVWIPACTRSGMVDLRVYRTGSTHLLSGDLYAFRLHLPGPDIFPLPFTYPRSPPPSSSPSPRCRSRRRPPSGPRPRSWLWSSSFTAACAWPPRTHRPSSTGSGYCCGAPP